MRKRTDVAVVLDFDGTLTAIIYALMVLVDTRAIPASARAELDAMRARYAPKFHAGKLTPREERDWFIRSVELYIKHGLSITAACEAIKDVRLKACVDVCLRRLHDMGVPVAIISFGVLQFIEEVLRNNAGLGRFVDRIYAADLIVDPKTGIVTGCDMDTIVLPATKGLWSRAFAEEMGVPKDRIIAVGDTRGDRHLGSRKALRLGLATGADSVEHLRPHMGEIIVDGESFEPAMEWILAKVIKLIS